MDALDTNSETYFVIMAGGIGSRFWPASRESLPKQFLDVLGTGRSLIQMTVDRIRPLVSPDRILVLTHDHYRGLVAEHLPELPAQNILVEPSRQNTAPCVAYVSFHLRARDPQSNLVILPADHLITREVEFQNTLRKALDYAARHDAILTLGMAPHRPDTGYGYIHVGDKTTVESIYHVESFREKPTREVATAYLESGEYVWNAGIFISSVKTMLTAFETLAPDIFNTLDSPDQYGSGTEQRFIREQYPKTPSISLDYAIMEKADNIVTYVVDIGWSDIGTWRSLYDLRCSQQGEIVVNGPEVNYDITNSNTLMIHSPADKKVLIRGLEGMLVVDQEDILMIWPLDEEQDIKDARNRLGPKWGME